MLFFESGLDKMVLLDQAEVLLIEQNIQKTK